MSTEAAREALVATVMAVLRLQSRHSVHPADQAALRRAAARIAIALQADFCVVARRSPTTERIDHQQLSERIHE